MTTTPRGSTPAARLLGRLSLWLAAAASALALAPAAQAVPSFTRQTGMDCAACHVGGYGPQLTPTGIRFKLGGYQDTDGKGGKIPLSAMVLASWTRTHDDQDPPPDGLNANDNATLDEASVFLAGKYFDHVGGFVQVTHDGVADQNFLDQADLRLVNTFELGGKDTLVGLSLNNNPGVQDPFNTLPVWGYPYLGSPAGFGFGDAAALIDGGLEGRVAGVSAYTVWNDSLYAELGTYQSMSPQTQDHLGLGTDEQQLKGNTYWRLSWMQDNKRDAWHVGAFGWSANLLPDRTVGGPADSYRDLGLDAGYQYLGTHEHVFTLDATWINERSVSGDSGDRAGLHTERLAAGYSWRSTFGASAGLFNTSGSDPSDSTRGLVLQADWTPWGKESASLPDPFASFNLRLGAQYWMYNNFDGVSQGASGHDTLYLFAWAAF